MVKHKLTTKTINIDKLTRTQKDQLAQDLYPIQDQVFANVNFNEFKKYVIDNPANSNKLQLYFVDRKIVGYIALHRFDMRLDNKKIHVFRMESGLLHEYRGLNIQYGFLFRFIGTYVLSHPFETCYYLGTLVHPSSYCSFSNYFTIYPSYYNYNQERTRIIVRKFRDLFHLDQPFSDNEWVTTVGWVTRDTHVETKYWHSITKPCANFYLDMNPEYAKGYGLITVFEIGVSAAINSIKIKFKKFLLPYVYKFANLNSKFIKLIYKNKIKKYLHSMNIFSDVDTNDLINNSYPIFLPKGAYLFNQGDPSDGLYILISGRVYVLIKKEEENIIVDQLIDMSVIGEVGSLTKIPRTASIRTIDNAIFIKISQYLIDKMLFSDTKQNRDMLKKIGIKLLENYLNSIIQQDAWMKINEHEEAIIYASLHKRQQLESFKELRYVFLFSGFIQISSLQGEHTWCANGQFLFKLDHSQTVSAIEDSYLLIISPDLIRRSGLRNP